MRREQVVYEPRIEQSREKVYTIVDLESLSASVLYGSGPLGGSGPLKEIPELKYFKETIRFDSHPPYGDHLNYETWLKLKGSKKGRYLKLDNIHISLEDDK